MVEDPDKDVFKSDGVTRSIEPWNRGRHAKFGDRGFRNYYRLSGDLARRIGGGAGPDGSRPVRLRQPRHQRQHGSVLRGPPAICASTQYSRSITSTGCDAACAVSKRSQELTRDILAVTKVSDAAIRAKSGILAPSRAGRHWAGWSAGPRRAAGSRLRMNMDFKARSHIAARMRWCGDPSQISWI